MKRILKKHFENNCINHEFSIIDYDITKLTIDCNKYAERRVKEILDLYNIKIFSTSHYKYFTIIHMEKLITINDDKMEEIIYDTITELENKYGISINIKYWDYK